MARQTKEKDMSVYREADDAKTQRERRGGVLTDHSLQHRVALQWDLNEEAVADQMFRLTVDDYVVILDKEQLLRLLRWV